MDMQAPDPPLPAWVKNALKLLLHSNCLVFEIPQQALIRSEYIEFWSQRLNGKISSNNGTGFDKISFGVYGSVSNVPISFESPASKDRFVALLQQIPIKGDQLDQFLFSGYIISGSYSPDFWETLGHLKTRKLELRNFHLTGEGQSSAFSNFLQTQDRPNLEKEKRAFWGLQQLHLNHIVVDSEFKYNLERTLGHMTNLGDIDFKIRLAGEQDDHVLHTDFAVPMLLSSAGSLHKIDMEAVGNTKVLTSLGQDFPALEDLRIWFDDKAQLKLKCESIQRAFESNTCLLSLDVCLHGDLCPLIYSDSTGQNIYTNLTNLTARNKLLKQLKESEPTLPYKAWAWCIHRLCQPLIEQKQDHFYGKEILHHPHAGKSALFHFLRETFIPGHPLLLQPERTNN